MNRQELKVILKQIHQLFFKDWEGAHSFKTFAEVLGEFLEVLIEKSFLKNYPLNINIATKMLTIKDELLNASFNKEHFPQEEIFKIFENKIAGEMVSFLGSPLKGLQLLGLFETRSLNFEHVIVMDLNEGILPNLKIYEPLIPREVMVSLKLDRLELEEEIQRYQFMRLISSAQNVHLVYQESKDREKSRFVEELIWEEQKKSTKLEDVKILKPSFEVNVGSKKIVIPKTLAMVEMLKNHKYSASSINTYLRNPLEFYYTYVLGLREREDLLDEPEARHVGTFIHELLEESFKPFLKKKPKINAAFRNRFAKLFEDRFEETLGKSMKADSFLLKAVMVERLNRFLDNEETDPQRQVEEILYLENRFEETVSLPCGEIRFKYIVDRIDRLRDGTVMIIDYKTGSVDQMPKAIDHIARMELSRQSIKENVRSFQIPLYFHYLNKQFKEQNINAALYNLKTLKLHKFINEKTSSSRDQIQEVFTRALDFILSEIFDIKVGFEDDKDDPYRRV